MVPTEGTTLSDTQIAIRLEVWRIGDSPPAVRLNPVGKPSEWKEKAKRSEGKLAETEQLQEEFWTEFRDRIQELFTPLRPRKPRPLHYYSNPIGKSGFHISFGVTQKIINSDSDLSLKTTKRPFGN
ncbi:DUF4268 domain-containing protein [Haladaptatus sp. SPP-AMP-3]|uniref:DUF4268 domain-containing protein n=1 Tax=Haladaptatus sp. SPP-AMP-3 TaxID=3121295 RepID=UPI003C2B4BC4